MDRDVLPICTALLAAILLNNVGCSSHQACSTPSCGKGKICVAGLCRNKQQVLAAQSTQRVTLEPTRFTVLVSKGANKTTRSDVPFGKKSLGKIVLLLDFPNPFTATTQILSAFIVLEPAPGTIPGPAPVELRVTRIAESWSPNQTVWATLPALSAIDSTFLASTWGGRTLRLDVTRQVRRWREHRDDDCGLAVVAPPQNDVGASYSLGLSGGRGPRLDVYLR